VLWHVFFVAIPLCGYIFVIYSGSKMLRLVKENLKADTSKTNNLNSQLTLNMIIQVKRGAGRRGLGKRRGVFFGHKSALWIKLDN
jgi:hypothetical protein